MMNKYNANCEKQLGTICICQIKMNSCTPKPKLALYVSPLINKMCASTEQKEVKVSI